jgi:hypothetical protein
MEIFISVTSSATAGSFSMGTPNCLARVGVDAGDAEGGLGDAQGLGGDATRAPFMRA